MECEDSEEEREERFSRRTRALAEGTERGTLGMIREERLSMRRTPPTYTQSRRDDSWRRREVMSEIMEQDGEPLEESGWWLTYKDSDEEPEAEVT